jgi:serine/threonine-protein kinase
MIGKVLDNRYELQSELGCGGMAWVYLAKDLGKNGKVACRILYPQHSQDLGFVRRFTQEAKLAMALTETGPEMDVIPVLDYGSDRETHYLVMDSVEGQDLRQVLDQWGSLLWQEAPTQASVRPFSSGC